MLVFVAIIGVLAAIAIPAYQDYTLRAKVAAMMPVVEKVESAAAAYVNEHGAYPNSPAAVGLPEELEAGPVSRIEVTDKGFELTLRSENTRLDGRSIVVSAYRNDDGSISWQCVGGTLEPKYRPQRCRAQ